MPLILGNEKCPKKGTYLLFQNLENLSNCVRSLADWNPPPGRDYLERTQR